MPLILHLSDLHLVAVEESPAVGVHKASLVPAAQRETHHEALLRTFRGLQERLHAEGRALDSIVISGDVADRNHPGGYDAFLELLDALGDIRPSPGRIVVVPGNHDVQSGFAAGDPARYEPFARRVRAAGFVTPLLDGIDSQPPSTEAELDRHLLRLEDLEIIPINSAGFSQVRLETGITEDKWQAVERALGDDEEAVQALGRLRIADAARVDPKHLDAVRVMLDLAARIRADGSSEPSESGPFSVPLRIAVLHHQLLPVSLSEEIKSFESITNLGLVRQFLGDNGISIVLHGHKHERFTYVDYVPTYDDPTRPPRPIRVIAGAAPSGSTLDPTDVGRLIDINSHAPYLVLESVPVGVAGRRLGRGERKRFSIMRPGAATAVRTAGITVIDGEAIAFVYRQLMARMEDAGGATERVICRIATSPRDEEISALYPVISPATTAGVTGQPDIEAEESPGERLRRFRELVEWWQYPALVGANDQPAFTHGTRILRYDGHLDQLAEVAAALRRDTRTSRGVVVLLSPTADRVADLNREFPSFCMAQFLVRTSATGDARLECLAYFRKQEVRFWWLVNVAEIASLQRRLAKMLVKGAGDRGAALRAVEPGSITTLAALVHAGQSPPKVQVPKIDQYYTRERERLFAMVNALLWPDMPGRAGYAQDWLEVLLSMVPAPIRDPDGVAVASEGVRYLRREVRRHLAEPAHQADDQLLALERSLERLWNQNLLYRNDDRQGNADQERHAEWRAAVEPLIREIAALTYARILPASVPD